MRQNKVFLNLKLVIAIAFSAIISTIIYMGFVIEIERGNISTASESDKVGSQIICIVLILLFDITILSVLVPKWFVIIEFSKNGLYIYKPFKKNFFIAYSKIRQITMATYNHIGFHPKYIVLATRKLSPSEKTHINLVNDDNVVILRKRKKVLKLLKKYQLTIT